MNLQWTASALVFKSKISIKNPRKTVLDNLSFEPDSGPHQIIFSKVHDSIAFVTLEFYKHFQGAIGGFLWEDTPNGNGSQIGGARWELPDRFCWPHTIAEDRHGNLYAAIKGKENQQFAELPHKGGGIARLIDPVAHCSSITRIPVVELTNTDLAGCTVPASAWSYIQFAGSGQQSAPALAFCVTSSADHQYIWFNSITTNQVGRITTTDAAALLIDTGGSNSSMMNFTCSDEDLDAYCRSFSVGSRPGSIQGLQDGSVLVAMYSSSNMRCKVCFRCRELCGMVLFYR